VLVGLLDQKEVDGDRVLMLVRVSSASQADNTSKTSQREALEKAVEKINGTVVEVLEAEESAAEIERSQLNKALEMAENDEYDVLMVYEVDRLSRADPWDTVRYLHDLRQTEITLYCDSYGYIDWNEHYDFEILSREAVFARRWLDRLRKGRVEGCERKLKNGKWPFGGDPPVGYNTDDENNIKLNKEYAKFIPDVFEMYLETQNRSETKRRFNTMLEEAGLEPISYPQVKTILQSKLVLGRLEYAGEVVTTNPELELVDKSVFQEVQSLLSNQGSRSATATKPDFLGEAVDQFGLDFVMDLLDIFQPFRCRSCNGDLERHASTEIWDIKMPNYRCTECDHQDPLVTETELKNLHQTLPLRCPYCIAAEDFEVEELRTSGSIFDYKYSCELCGYAFGSNMEPDQIRRMLSHPELKFSITSDDESTEEEAEPDEDNQQTFVDFN
jgi:DNA invertase Pin-like site-specific DNA recombinase/DNA-directed RNA polymerase subunit RPC12/RpoP